MHFYFSQMDITTPPNQCVRPRHTPTPKMSERKKALFGGKLSISLPETIDEDSDLGPMSPLQFSCSPTTYEPLNDIHGRFSTGCYIRDVRRDFRNICNQMTPPKKELLTTSSSSSSPHQSPMQSSSMSNQKSLVTTSPPAVSTALTPPFGGGGGKENQTVLRTPSGESTCTSTMEFPRVSFRKSLIFDTGITPESGAVTTSHLTPNTRKCVQKRTIASGDPNDDASPLLPPSSLSSSAAGQPSKARASLSFSEPVISARTFYGASFNSTPIKRAPPLKTISSVPSMPHRPSRRNRVPTKKRATIQRPVLGGGGGGVRRKTIGKMPKKTTNTTTMKTMSKSKILEAAINLIENKIKKSTTSSSSSPSPTTSNEITRAQIERLQAILKQRRDPFELSSRPLNWTGSKSTAASTVTTSHNDSMFSESLLTDTSVGERDEPQPDDDEQIAEEVTKKRKFFKSKTSSTQSVYRISNTMSATLKRGATLKIVSPKRKKQRVTTNDCKFFFVDIL